MKFKVGDKVKILSNDDCFISKGSVCDVVSYDIFSSNCVKIVVAKSGCAS